MSNAPQQLSADDLRNLLDELSWKQSELARRTGLTHNTISRWATGQVETPLWVGEYLNAMVSLRRLAVRFGVAD